MGRFVRFLVFYPIVVAASKRGIKRCIVAQENVAEAAFVEQMEGSWM